VAAPGDDGHRLVRDDASRLGGRGLYVCRGGECFGRAVARRAFERGARLGGAALRVDPDVIATLESER